jgi:hypothetical protein
MRFIPGLLASITIAACLMGQLATPVFAVQATGGDFPGTKCTCKGCGTGGGDVTGQCSNVCKDKTVYSKGSEPYDYCKAAGRLLPIFGRHAIPPANSRYYRAR